jgi:hypothetical protein
VGPAGVFVIDTKRLHGDASVRKGVLCIRWREDPNDGYRDARIGSVVKQHSTAVARHLNANGLEHLPIQAVVVLWASFEQGSVLSGDVAWIRGDALVGALGRRPHALTPDQVNRTFVALQSFDGAV